jgi:hypothetical protein
MTTLALAQGSSRDCPDDVCRVTIKSVVAAGDELELEFEANFIPEMSGVHIHVWWGARFTPDEVSLHADHLYGVEVGEWDPTDDYPRHTTTGASSTAARDGTHILCVSASNAIHDLLNPKRFHCIDVQEYL